MRSILGTHHLRNRSGWLHALKFVGQARDRRIRPSELLENAAARRVRKRGERQV